MLFILCQASYGVRVALSIFGFECIEVDQRILLLLLLPDACEFGLNVFALSSRNSTHHIAQLMDHAALARRCGKQLINGGKQAVVSIGDQQIDLSGSSSANVL